MLQPSRRTTAVLGVAAVVALGVPAYAAGNGHGKSGDAPGHNKSTGDSGGTTSSAPQFTPGMRLKDANGQSTLAAEPSIDVDAAGTPYVTGPAGVPTGGCPFWKISPDSSGLGYTYEGRFDTDHEGAGGGDCDVTSTGPGKVGVSSLSLANLTTNTSTDGGQHWQDPANPFGQQVFGDDRQWQAVDNSLGVTYLTVHDLYTSNIQVATSYDGGYTYLQNVPAITPDQIPTAQGDNHFSTTVIGPDHKLYIAYVAPADAAENAQVQAGQTSNGNEHVVYLAVGDPCAASCAQGQVGPISWTDYQVYAAPSGQDLGHDFPAVAVDKAGTVYVGWAGDTGSTSTNQVNVATVRFTNGSPQVAGPITVSQPGGFHSNMFPWLEAGDAGRADVVWYAGTLTSPSSGDCPSGYSGAVDDSSGVSNNCHQQWTVGFSQTQDSGGTWSAPTAASAVVHHGSICDQGLNCSLFGGDRTLLDFFDMALDGTGAANIAYAEDVDSPGTATIVYGRQCAGPSTSTATPTVSYSCTPAWTDVLGAPAPAGPPYDQTQTYVANDAAAACPSNFATGAPDANACFAGVPGGQPVDVSISDATGQLVSASISYRDGAGNDLTQTDSVCGSGRITLPAGAAYMYVYLAQATAPTVTDCAGAQPATTGTVTVKQ